MKPITVSTSLPQHAPSIKAPKPLPKPPQNIESQSTAKSNSLSVKKTDHVLITSQAASFAKDLEEKRERLENEAGK